MRKFPALALFLFYTMQLVGCAGSLPTNVFSLASILVTGKGISDHALSMTTGQDCAVFNLLQEATICEGHYYAPISLLVTSEQVQDTFLILTPEQFLAYEISEQQQQSRFISLASLSEKDLDRKPN